MLLLKLILLAIVMILGFSAVFIGGMVIFVSEALVPGIGLLVIGLVVGVGSLRVLLRLNRAFQDEHLEAVLADPQQIRARWQDRRGEVILAPRGVFIGRSYYPFAASYQRLAELSFDVETGQLFVAFDSIAPPPNHRPTLTLEVPADRRGSVAAFADALRRGRAPGDG